MKKILWTTTLISLCTSNLLAQDMPNQDTNINTKASKEEKKPIEIKKLDKTGFFIGGSLAIGASDSSKLKTKLKRAINNDYMQEGSYYNNTFFTTDLSIIGGYQKYFGETQRHGARGVFQFGFSSKSNVDKGVGGGDNRKYISLI